MREIRDEILEAGLLVRKQAKFAGGDRANNHLSLDRLPENPELFDRVTTAMAHLIVMNECRIDFLAPIPEGGNVFAEAISEKLARQKRRVPIVHFRKTDDGLFLPRGSYARGKLKESGHGVVIDDVSTRLSTLARLLETPGMENQQLSFCAVWRRGNEDIETTVDIHKYWVVEEYIPSQLPDNSALWSNSHQTKTG